MAKISELLAERKRREEAFNTRPELPQWNGRVRINDDGHLEVADYTIRQVSDFSVWLSDLYSDPTPPDAATLRKAELFEELVNTLGHCEMILGQLSPHVAGGSYQAYKAAGETLAKAKAAKGGEG